jgi:hypothetical protein
VIEIRQFDAVTILYNTFFDAKRMLDGNMRAKKVVEYIEKKINFLKHPPPGNKIRWM